MHDGRSRPGQQRKSGRVSLGRIDSTAPQGGNQLDPSARGSRLARHVNARISRDLFRLGLICVLRNRAVRQHWHRTPVA